MRQAKVSPASREGVLLGPEWEEWGTETVQPCSLDILLLRTLE